MKLNKQVNTIPWLSVTQECAQADRRELIRVAWGVICVADVLDPQEHRATNEASPQVHYFMFGLTGEWISDLGLIAPLNRVGQRVAMSRWGRMSRRRGRR